LDAIFERLERKAPKACEEPVGPITIRAAREEDKTAMAEVEVSSVRSSRRGIYDDSYLERLNQHAVAEELRRVLGADADGTRLWVAERSGTVVAFAQTDPWPEASDSSTAYLANLYVKPQLFRQGVGSQLLHFVEEELRAAGFQSVLAWVVEDARAAQSFYSAQAWRPTGRFKDLLLDRRRVVQLWQKTLSRP
jgi:ribosomal protein S18 acetylase RimI-like enzyme